MEKNNIVVSGKIFTKKIIKGVNNLIKNKPEMSRNQIASEVCEWLNWKNPKGDKQISSCNVALRKLDSKGIIQLPEPKRKAPPISVPISEIPVPVPINIPGTVEEIKGLYLHKVTAKDNDHMRIWNSLIVNEHPLSIKRLVGRQMRYLIGSKHGWLGAIGFSAAAWCLRARDSWIRWDEITRQERLHLIANLSRFLIRNTVNCKNLASKVLSLCIKQLQKDWEIRYGEKLVLLETFVNPKLYKGTCFQAANWKRIGQTVGRGRQDRYNLKKETCKDIYVLPLYTNFRQLLGGKEKIIKPRKLVEGENWTVEEFSNLQLRNKRLVQRAKEIAKNRWNNPSASFPQSFRDFHQLKSAYRFFSNSKEQISMRNMLKTHHYCTLQRMASENVVLAISDTTSFNYNSICKTTKGLGPIGSNKGPSAQGFHLHSTLALNERGIPLGLLGTECWAREEEKKEQKKSHQCIPIEEKESYKWIKSYNIVNEAASKLKNTFVINVCDREGDIYDLFEKALLPKSKSHLLVRAAQNRCIRDSQNYLWSYMSKLYSCGELDIEVPRKQGKKARIAHVEVRCSKVPLESPNRWDGKKHSPLSLWCVYITEVGNNSDDRIEWMLLTTLQTESFKNAVKIVKWYCRRWVIEEWHFVIKSGCNVEKRQLETAKALMIALSFDLVIAWRILMQIKLGRQFPKLPCTVVFKKNEWKVLFEIYNKKKIQNSGITRNDP